MGRTRFRKKQPTKTMRSERFLPLQPSLSFSSFSLSPSFFHESERIIELEAQARRTKRESESRGRKSFPFYEKAFFLFSFSSAEDSVHGMIRCVPFFSPLFTNSLSLSYALSPASRAPPPLAALTPKSPRLAANEDACEVKTPSDAFIKLAAEEELEEEEETES